MSHTLSDSQKRWAPYEQELYAVVFSLEMFKHYIEGTKFKVLSDHKPLAALLSQPNLNKRQARWVHLL